MRKTGSLTAFTAVLCALICGPLSLSAPLGGAGFRATARLPSLPSGRAQICATVRLLAPASLRDGGAASVERLLPSRSSGGGRRGSSGELLLAGAAREDLTPDLSKDATPLGGYAARMGRPAAGVHDPIYVRALVVRSGDNEAGICSVDLCFLPGNVVADVRQELRRMGAQGLAQAPLFLAATHTHTAPDPLAIHDRNRAPEPKGWTPYDAELRAFIARRIARSLAAAKARLAPASLFAKQIEVPGLVRNRRGDPVLDRCLTALELKSATGRTLASVIIFACHPTIYPATMMQISEDWPGVMESDVERVLGGQCLYLNGAEGDAAPGAFDNLPAPERVRAFGDAVAGWALRSLRAAQPAPNPVLAAWQQQVALPARKANGIFLLSAAALGLGYKQAEALVKELMPLSAPLSFAHIGPALLIGFPCEPSGALGIQARNLAERAGYKIVAPVALVDAWLAYALTPQQYNSGRYEAGMSFYGPNLGPALLNAVQSGLERMRRGDRAASLAHLPTLNSEAGKRNDGVIAGACGGSSRYVSARACRYLRLAQAAAAQRPPVGTVRVAFAFSPPPALHAAAVDVAGSFNRWSPTASPLSEDPQGATWRGTLDLRPGLYTYKFVVNGRTWLTDPAAPTLQDGGGNINSFLVVPPAEYARLPGREGDGIITVSVIRHLPGRDLVRLDRAHFGRRLRTRAHDVQRVFILSRGARGVKRFAMHRTQRDELYDTWQGALPVTGRGQVAYAFEVEDGGRSAFYGRSGAGGTPAGGTWFTFKPRDYPLLQVPAWPASAVFYEIFPDRFANGDPANDGPGAQPWGSIPTPHNRMGGDLQGVLDHISYLQNLGADALYFTPLFTSGSNHGYDTYDYLRVDPRFGSNRLLRELVGRAHALGWHVILDGVFNHSGTAFFAFRSLLTHGASSPYRTWYFVRSFPIQVKMGQQTYVSWFNAPSLPKLNVDDPQARAYLLRVAAFWIRYARIDGWRLDSADQVDPSFWRAFRRTVKAADPAAYIVGEIWGDAAPWLRGDEFDSVMDYPWRQAVLSFFAQDLATPTQFQQTLASIREAYPRAATPVLFNMLGSHDTPRLLTACGGNVWREEQAVLFQMSYPGTPCIYYGDEIGMAGGADPADRACMDWNKADWNAGLLAFYKSAIRMRRSRKVFTKAEFRVVAADDASGLFAVERRLGAQAGLVIFNRSNQPLTVRVRSGRAPSLWLAEGASLDAHSGTSVVQLGPRGAAALGIEGVARVLASP